MTLFFSMFAVCQAGGIGIIILSANKCHDPMRSQTNTLALRGAHPMSINFFYCRPDVSICCEVIFYYDAVAFMRVRDGMFSAAKVNASRVINLHTPVCTCVGACVDISVLLIVVKQHTGQPPLYVLGSRNAELVSRELSAIREEYVGLGSASLTEEWRWDGGGCGCVDEWMVQPPHDAERWTKERVWSGREDEIWMGDDRWDA